MPTELRNKVLTLLVLEPLNFGTDRGYAIFDVTVVRTGADVQAPHKELLLLRLPQPVPYEGATYEYLVAWPRGQREDFSALAAGESVTVEAAPISGAGALSEDPFDPRWRAGVRLVGVTHIPPNEEEQARMRTIREKPSVLPEAQRRVLYILHRGLVEMVHLAMAGKCDQIYDLADAIHNFPGLVDRWDDAHLKEVRRELTTYARQHPDAFKYLEYLDNYPPPDRF